MGDEDGVNMFPGPDVRKKIQFWSDARGKEFAVRLSNEPDFRAVSNLAVTYVKLVDEAEYFDDMAYDWKYLLDHWTGVKNGSIRLLDLEDGREQQPAAINLADLQSDTSIIGGKKIKRTRRTKPKPPLKCHYCMLYYNSEKERSEHEALWHMEKKKRSS